ncbi:hypothetical protein KJ969_02830, partial [Patescibacteria group bacterium]|nr:hypothetical protein [Patescibacteria group bacterium]MBU1922040.1 hypothetical protein [Patescibacteria group bacterium]
MSSERISTFFPGTERPAEAEKPVEEEKILQEQLQENMADLVEYRLGEGQPITEEKRSNVMKVEATEMAKVREEIERIKEMKSFVAKLKGGEELSVEDKNRAKEVIGGWLADISNQQKENFDKIKSFDSDKARLEQEYEDMSADLAAK